VLTLFALSFVLATVFAMLIGTAGA
jgi:hypothetical protein